MDGFVKSQEEHICIFPINKNIYIIVIKGILYGPDDFPGAFVRQEAVEKYIRLNC